MNQISEDSLDRHHVAFFRSRLVPCTHANTQHNIGSRCAEVEKRADHGSVYLTVRIEFEMTFSLHRGGDAIKIRHLESLEHVLNVFCLIYEGPFSKLFDFKTKKEP